MNEIWRDIINAPGYQCSNYGRIRSIDRVIEHPTAGKINRKGILLGMQIDKGGYTRIRFRRCPVTPLVHRLVAELFIKNPLNKPWVNHKDGDKSNNHFSNLEWSTISENVQHAYDNNLNYSQVGENCSSHKLSQSDIIKIRDLSATGKMRKDLAADFGVTPECISSIVLRKTWKHI